MEKGSAVILLARSYGIDSVTRYDGHSFNKVAFVWGQHARLMPSCSTSSQLRQSWSSGFSSQINGLAGTKEHVRPAVIDRVSSRCGGHRMLQPNGEPPSAAGYGNASLFTFAMLEVM